MCVYLHWLAAPVMRFTREPDVMSWSAVCGADTVFHHCTPLRKTTEVQQSVASRAVVSLARTLQHTECTQETSAPSETFACFLSQGFTPYRFYRVRFRLITLCIDET